MLRSAGIVLKPALRPQWSYTKFYSTQLNVKIEDGTENKFSEDPEWNNALPFSQIPGPSKLGLTRAFLPGGKFYKTQLPGVLAGYREEYGDIFKLPGVLGKFDTVVTFDPENFHKIFRTEGAWPQRQILESVLYHRQKHRPSMAKNLGLALTQGKEWGDFRSLTNPVLLQPKIVKLYVPHINGISDEITKSIREIRDPKTFLTPPAFEDEVKSWTLESICLIALDTRLGLIGAKERTPEALKIINAIRVFLPLLAEMDLKIPFWKVIKTSNFKKYLQSLDDMVDVADFYVNKAINRLESQPDSQNKNQEESVLKKLLKIDPSVARTMAQDMLIAGVDTTSSSLISLIYHLSKNPAKQKILQEELKKILPNKDSPLTPENMKHMPYLRACSKESARLTPVVPANTRNTGQKIVLSGYQVPKGVTILMPSGVLQVDEKYFPRPEEFIPERWLKNQPEGCPNAKTANPFIFLPFGFGPRSCIGKRFAELEIEVMISKIFRNFFVEWAREEDLKFKVETISLPDGDILFKFMDLDN